VHQYAWPTGPAPEGWPFFSAAVEFHWAAPTPRLFRFAPPRFQPSAKLWHSCYFPEIAALHDEMSIQGA
jgi:hypothetical protein